MRQNGEAASVAVFENDDPDCSTAEKTLNYKTVFN
jgi:hypothetical protein